MSQWVENQVIERVIESPFFSLQLDESTDVEGLCQLLVFVRYRWNSETHEDMLLCEPISRSTSEEIFNAVDIYIRTKSLDWLKCIGIRTDGARAMCGRNSSVVTKILERNPNASWTHCNLHRAALVSKHLSDNFKNVLNTSVKIVNFIKSKPLQSRLFEKMCEEMGSNHRTLLLHTEIRWLSRGKVLTRLGELREEVAMFLEGKCDFAKCLRDEEFILRLTYLADIFSKLNKLNLYLQGTQGIFEVHDKIRGFMKKLALWKNCIDIRNYECFEMLQTFIIENEVEVCDGIMSEISEHLNKLKESFEFYFHDEMNTLKQKRWVINPFQPAITTGISTKADEELINLSENSSSKMNFSRTKLVQFWVSLLTLYPLISTEALKALMPFSSSYKCETGFSAMVVVTRTQDGKLATKVHRKPTHTNRYLNYHSAHSNEQKQGVVINLYNRAQSLTTKSTDWKKKSFLSHMLAENDYPNWFIQKALKKRKTQAQVKLQEEERHIGLVILPFIPGITERLKRLLKNHQIKVATKPLRTVGNMLPSLTLSLLLGLPCPGTVFLYPSAGLLKLWVATPNGVA